MRYNLKSRVRIRFVSDSPGEGIGFSLKYDMVTSPTIIPTTFDFTVVHAKAALRSGTRSGAAPPVNQTDSPVNQTAIETTAATSNITDTPTQSADSQNLTSGVDIPLSAFTSKAPMNLTIATDAVIQLTSESIEQPGPTTSPRIFPATGITTRDKIWTSTAHVVMAVEDKKVEEKVPDIIILGPSVPVVMIFVLVVAGIAWWNYKFNSEELNRYESYAQSNKAKRHKRHMKNISKGNLYNRMTKDWRGQSFSVTSRASPMPGKKISFAGKLRELAEGVRTPRPSPAHSEETIPLNKPATVTPAFLIPGATSTGKGSRPSSRPASLLLRDALINMFSGGESGDTQDSVPPSKRASKRVSFIDEEAGQPLVQHEDSPQEQIQEKHDVKPVKDNKGAVEEAPAKPRPLHIPAIIVRQPSEDVDYQTDAPSRRRRHPQQEFFEPEVFCEEESDDLEAALPENDEEGPGTRDDHDDNYQDSTPEEILDRSLIFPDLEDFLLNLDKDSPGDIPPYSCESHVRDILRKSYGDEGLGDLGPSTVLSVPDEYLGLVRGSSQSQDRAMSDSDHVDDVD